MEDHEPGTVERARKLRKKMTLPEGMLWQQLRQRPMGLKFRSQHPIGSFVVDFFCAHSKVVIEIDGIAHNMGDNPAHDTRRDAKLRALGLTVFRIPATDVLRDSLAVANSIIAHCTAVPPPSALRAATSPKGGDSLGVAA